MPPVEGFGVSRGGGRRWPVIAMAALAALLATIAVCVRSGTRSPSSQPRPARATTDALDAPGRAPQAEVPTRATPRRARADAGATRTASELGLVFRDEAGSPVAGVRVEMRRGSTEDAGIDDPAEADRAAVSDARGRVHWPLPAGAVRYRVLSHRCDLQPPPPPARGPGEQRGWPPYDPTPWSGPIRLAAGRTTELQIRCYTSTTVHGQVVNEHGAGVTARVRVFEWHRASTDERTPSGAAVPLDECRERIFVDTAGDGTFAIPARPCRAQVIASWSRGPHHFYCARFVELTAGDNDLGVLPPETGETLCLEVDGKGAEDALRPAVRFVFRPWMRDGPTRWFFGSIERVDDRAWIHGLRSDRVLVLASMADGAGGGFAITAEDRARKIALPAAAPHVVRLRRTAASQRNVTLRLYGRPAAARLRLEGGAGPRSIALQSPATRIPLADGEYRYFVHTEAGQYAEGRLSIHAHTDAVDLHLIDGVAGRYRVLTADGPAAGVPIGFSYVGWPGALFVAIGDARGIVALDGLVPGRTPYVTGIDGATIETLDGPAARSPASVR